MSATAERAQRGAAMAPLSREQKMHLVLAAKEAHAVAGGGENFDAWRAEQAYRAVGRRISTARNEDYLPLRAHFRNLAGDSGRAFRDHMRSHDEPRAQALHRLRIECQAAADVLPGAEAYVRGMLRNKGTSLDDASPKQLWHAIFTLRRKCQLERKKARPLPEVNCPF